MLAPECWSMCAQEAFGTAGPWQQVCWAWTSASYLGILELLVVPYLPLSLWSLESRQCPIDHKGNVSWMKMAQDTYGQFPSILCTGVCALMGPNNFLNDAMWEDIVIVHKHGKFIRVCSHCLHPPSWGHEYSQNTMDSCHGDKSSAVRSTAPFWKPPLVIRVVTTLWNQLLVSCEL